MERIDLLQKLILDGHKENHEEHVRIEAKLFDMEEKVTDIRLWKAKIMGAAVVISMLVSGAAYALEQLLK